MFVFFDFYRKPADRKVALQWVSVFQNTEKTEKQKRKKCHARGKKGAYV